MKQLLLLPATVLLLSCGDVVRVGPVKIPVNDQTPSGRPMTSFHSMTVTDIHGKPFALDQLKGKKVMVVITASECGFTPQYKQLQELYMRYKDKGLVIIGFPSNDFGGQE